MTEPAAENKGKQRPDGQTRRGAPTQGGLELKPFPSWVREVPTQPGDHGYEHLSITTAESQRIREMMAQGATAVRRTSVFSDKEGWPQLQTYTYLTPQEGHTPRWAPSRRACLVLVRAQLDEDTKWRLREATCALRDLSREPSVGGRAELCRLMDGLMEWREDGTARTSDKIAEAAGTTREPTATTGDSHRPAGQGGEQPPTPQAS